MKPWSEFTFFLLLIVIMEACSTRPYAKTNREYRKLAKDLSKSLRSMPADSIMADSMKLPQYKALTVNFGIRRPHYVILHHTAQNSCSKTISAFISKSSQVSAHYVICKDGTLHHMLNDYFRAWHAGASKWGSNSDINSTSIGIELDNDGYEEFPAAQINSLLGLLNTLKSRYNIPSGNFIGHGDIAPGRKVDPSVHFPWKLLADSGFGHWYQDTAMISVPADFNSLQALRIIGYSVTDTSATIQAFRRHFLGIEKDSILDEAEKKVLFAVMLKFM